MRVTTLTSGPAEVKPANPKPCAHCPWRLENQGKRHQHGFYTKANLRRLWAGLRRGARMSCHPTDSRMCDFEGYEHQADREVMHECTGALILQQREAMRFQDAIHESIAADPSAKDGLRRYRKAHPMGLLRDGLAEVLSRAMIRFPGEVKMARPNLNDPEVGYAPLGDWDKRDADA